MGIEAMSPLRAFAAALVAAALLAACAVPPTSADLATFLERRATCDHFRGEVPDPPDPQRMKEVEEQVELSCKGTDAQLAALKQRYRDDEAVSKQLAQFEPEVETK